MVTRAVWGGVLGLLALIPLAACVDNPVEVPVVTPPPVVAPAPLPAPAPQVDPDRSTASQELSLYYRRLQNDLLAQDLMRGDGGGVDTPFTSDMLLRNFIRIAMFDEYAPGGGTQSAEATPAVLRRWEQPIRMNIEFGATVPAAQRIRDTASIGAYAARLSRLTGVPIRQNALNANYTVMVLNEDDRPGFEGRLRSLIPGIEESTVRSFLTLPRDLLCIVISVSENNAPTYARAVVLIRGEHPDVMRLTCIHEELAQGMGLPNDSPQARPSIFNDDDEFGLLTTHDEFLLRMLYDPRLTPGMTAAQAEPIVRVIAAEYMSEGS
jgi:hypothetical protein